MSDAAQGPQENARPGGRVQGHRSRPGGRNPRHRAWCGTINARAASEEKEAYDGWAPLWDDHWGSLVQDGKIRYICWGREMGEEAQRKHLQIYVYFKNPITLAGAKRNLDCNWVHLEAARGTPQENRRYCSKGSRGDSKDNERHEDGRLVAHGDGNLRQFTELGELPEPGKRNDLHTIISGINDGSLTPNMVRNDYPDTWARNYRAIDIAFHRSQEEKMPKKRDVRVKVIWGKKGTGKTYAITQREESLYCLFCNAHPWFDGYIGQKALLIDEFDAAVANRVMNINTLKQICDGYRVQLPVKGGSVWAAWDRVYILSNVDPQYWYQGEPEESRAALFDRFDVCHLLGESRRRTPVVMECNDINEFLNL